MAITTGTASNYRDLLDRLRTFLTSDAALVAAGQQWTELRWSSDASNKELILRAPGLAGTEQIFVGIRTYEDATSGYYAWDLNGFIGFNAANTFYNQPGAIAGGGPPSGYLPMLALWNASIPYWLVANGRRLVLAAKVSTIYQAAYLGFILPYATPGQYPYPLLVGGSMTGERGRQYSTTGANHRHFVDPGEVTQNATVTACLLRTPGGVWSPWQNLYQPSSETRYDGARPVWPTNFTNLGLVRETLDGAYPLTPIALAQYVSANEHNLFGELQGCFHVSGFGNAAENLVQAGGVDHLVGAERLPHRGAGLLGLAAGMTIMAYQTGSVATATQLLDALRVFAVANGWTENRWGAQGAGYQLSLQKGGIHVHMRSAVSETLESVAPGCGFSRTVTGIWLTGATGYGSGSAWSAQPGTIKDTDYHVGGFAVVWQSDTRHEAVEIAAIVGNTLTLKNGLSSAWPAGCRVYPARLAHLEGETAIERITATVAQGRVRWAVEDLTAPAEGEAGPLYQGCRVFEWRADRSEALAQTWRRKLETLDFGTGQPWHDDLSGRPVIGRELGWLITSRAQDATFCQWLAARAGRCNPCWLPSAHNDLVATRMLVDTDTDVVVSLTGDMVIINWQTDRTRFTPSGTRSWE